MGGDGNTRVVLPDIGEVGMGAIVASELNARRRDWEGEFPGVTEKIPACLASGGDTSKLLIDGRLVIL